MDEEIIINKGYLDDLGTADLIALPIYLIIIFFIATVIKQKNIKDKPYYKYFTIAILFKIFGAISFCFIYTYYYKGGDTIGYFESTCAFCNLLVSRTSDFFDVFTSSHSSSGMNTFDSHTGYPWLYLYNEERTLFLIKLLTPIVFLSFKSYLLSTIVLACLCFVGVWEMFKMLVSYYPKYYKEIAIGIFFVPTVVFWGSGMLKDSVTLSTICWVITTFEKIFIKKVSIKKNIFLLLLFGYILISIKPYILMPAIPGLIIWVSYSRIHKIKNNFLRYSSIPFIITLSLVGGIFILSNLGDQLGKFSLDNIFETAVVTQDDLKRDAYGGNSYDIGKIDPSISGFIEKAPAAIMAGLYRPYFWEANNVVMLITGTENFALIILTLILIIRLKIFGIFRLLFDNPILLFLFLYSIIFAFSLGISTSNFGALIRFKIAFLPFFASTLLIMYKLIGEKK